MRHLAGMVIIAFGWVLIYGNSTDKFLSTVGGFLLMIGSVIDWWETMEKSCH